MSLTQTGLHAAHVHKAFLIHEAQNKKGAVGFKCQYQEIFEIKTFIGAF